MALSKYERVLQFYAEHDHHRDDDDRPAIPDRDLQFNASDPKRLARRNAMARRCDELKERCCRRLLLDIYVHCLPMDDGCAEGNRARYSGDIDAMLAAKGCSASQYFQSAAEKTKAPLLEYVNRYIDMVGQQFMEKQEEETKEAKEEGIDEAELPDSEVDEAEVENQLVDVKKDTEYEDFIDKLKRKTIKKIVSDISELINSKKDEENMTFSPPQPQTESAFIQAMDYISETMVRSNCEPDWQNDDLMELAVREFTLFALNECFGLSDRTLGNFRQGLALDRGLVVTEGTIRSVCFENGYLEASTPDRYLETILENSRYLEELTGDYFSEGIVSAIGHGAKAIWEWLKALVNKIRDWFKRKLKPTATGQIESIESIEKVKSESFKAAGISVPKSKPSKGGGRSQATVVTNSSLSTDKAETLATKAGKGLELKSGDGTIYTDDSRNVRIRFSENIQVISFGMYFRWLDELVEPAIKNGFRNRHDINRIEDKFGPEGNRIPVENDSFDQGFDLSDIFFKCELMIDKLDRITNDHRVKAMAEREDIDPYFEKLMIGLGCAANTVNLMLNVALNSLKVRYQMPFTEEEIAAIKTQKDLGKVVAAIIAQRNFGRSGEKFALTRPLITEVAKHNHWIIDDAQVKSGTARIVIMDNKQSKYLYKYAWNRKGISDNLLDLKIKQICSEKMAKLLALPTDESSSTGAYVVVPRVKLPGESGAPIPNQATLNELTDRFNDAAKEAKVSIKAEDIHQANVGWLGNDLVVIDYGNFRIRR